MPVSCKGKWRMRAFLSVAFPVAVAAWLWAGQAAGGEAGPQPGIADMQEAVRTNFWSATSTEKAPRERRERREAAAPGEKKTDAETAEQGTLPPLPEALASPDYEKQVLQLIEKRTSELQRMNRLLDLAVLLASVDRFPQSFQVFDVMLKQRSSGLQGRAGKRDYESGEIHRKLVIAHLRAGNQLQAEATVRQMIENLTRTRGRRSFGVMSRMDEVLGFITEFAETAKRIEQLGAHIQANPKNLEAKQELLQLLEEQHVADFTGMDRLKLAMVLRQTAYGAHGWPDLSLMRALASLQLPKLAMQVGESMIAARPDWKGVTSGLVVREMAEALFKAGDYVGALAKFQELNKSRPSAYTAQRIQQCRRRLGFP